MIIDWEEYHDTATNVKYNLPQFSLEEYDTEEDFYYKNNVNLYSRIFSSIEFAILNKLQIVPCFILNGFIMNVDKPLFSEKLEECRQFFEAKEIYEKCAQIVKLQELNNQQ